jgi:phospholipid/cholesterol/gamma-HCH transport system substrate-binding protein
MEPEAKYTLVGVAVLLLLGALAASFVWLRSEGGEDQFYKIYFERHSLEGLQIRSDVKMRGIRVGSVDAFRISAWRPGAVEVVIAVERSTPVRESTRAVVERHLLTGLASIRLENTSEDSPPLRKRPEGEVYPVIAEGESRFEQLSESMNQLVVRADETMRRINTTLSDQNQAALTEVLDNLRRVSRSADRSLARLDATLASVGGAADEVRALSSAVAQDARKLAARYDSLGEEATVSVREVAAATRKMSADVAQLSARADALLASGDEELRSTAQALRTAADSLGAAAGRLRDPASVIFGPPPGGVGPGERAR